MINLLRIREEILICHQAGEVEVPVVPEAGAVVQGVEAVVQEDIAVHRIVVRLIEVLRVEAQQADSDHDIINRQEYRRIFCQKRFL